jgi:hypothetical protein
MPRRHPDRGKSSHPDEQFAKQQLDLLLISMKAIDVGGHSINLQHLHSPLDATNQCFLFVIAEVVAKPGPQDGGNFRQVLAGVAAGSVAVLGRDRQAVALVVDELRQHILP